MAEVLHGNASANQLNATTDKTQVYGLAGNDTLTSDGKSGVLLVGGSGSDSLIMSGGNGTLSGGTGADTFELNYSATQTISAVIEDVEPASDKIVVNFDGTATPTLNSVASGSDVVLSDSDGQLNVTLKGVRENDYFDGDASDKAWEILKLTNDEREKQTATDNINRPWLTMSDGLTKAAEIRVQEITELDEQEILDIYKHERPYNKGGYSTVFDEVGKHYSAYAENITAGESTAAEAMQDWIDSDSHNINIWNPNYLKLGVGYNHLPIGSHSASQLDYWEQLFGGSLRQTEMETVSTADLLTTNPEVHTISTAVTLTEGNDTYNNSVFGATIAALGGGDSISNSGLKVSINGGANNDTIDNRASFVTINAGTGDDSIRLSNAQEVLIQFAAGDGSDTISGINSSDTLSISGGEYMPVTVGNDVVVSLGADSITLSGAARSNVQIVGTRSKLYLGTEGDDTIKANVNGATIDALGGNDTITNSGSNASINAGAGNDSITNSGQNVVFFHEGGDDTINGFNSTSTLQIVGGSYASVTSGYYDLILINSDSTDSIKILNAYFLSSINIVDANSNTVTIGNAKDIRGTEQADNLSNDLDGATIRAFGGDDTITNSGERVTIIGGTGNDSINLNGINNLILYKSGEGNDSVRGFDKTSTLSISAEKYTRSTVNNDIVISVNSETITLLDAASLSSEDIHIDGMNSSTNVISNHAYDKLVTGTADDDFIFNYAARATIQALGGNDSISNVASSISIDAGVDDDYIENWWGSHNVTILGGTGDDSIKLDNTAEHTLIQYAEGDGNDSVSGIKSYDTISITNGTYTRLTVGDDIILAVGTGSIRLVDAARSYPNVFGTESEDLIKFITLTEGNDSLRNAVEGVTIAALGGNDSIVNGMPYYGSSHVGGANVSVSGATGNDTIYNYENATNSTISGGADDDTIYNFGENVLINGDEDNDYIFNSNSGDFVTINGGTGNDSIYNNGDSVSVSGGDGNDTIYNSGTDVSMLGGSGDDRISLSSSSRNNFVRYADGDGNDTVWGITENDTLNLLADETLTSSVVSGDDLIINVGAGSILLVGARNKPPKITYGESGTEGGNSSSGGNSGGSSSGSSGGGRGGNDGGNVSGGTSSNEGMTSDASGNKSAVGSRGRSSRGSAVSNSSNVGRIRVSRPIIDTTNETRNTNLNFMTTSTQQTVATDNRIIYTGGDQVVPNYTADRKIFFLTEYVGSFYDGAGNYFAGSTTGALVLQNATDKVIDLNDAAGNVFVKAYAATNAGVIDGRGLAGFEMINGSAGSDAIFAGDGGSQLWGGLDVAADVLVGGGGTDIFIGGRTQGADVIANASSTDIVHLNDATLSDIVATAENNGAIAIAFNTGNVVGVQSSEALSATFMLADGSAYRYNHANKSWQSA